MDPGALTFPKAPLWSWPALRQWEMLLCKDDPDVLCLELFPLPGSVGGFQSCADAKPLKLVEFSVWDEGIRPMAEQYLQPLS